MSDFDREAERERLREKYEQDKNERETTERMSELLLQGATMTNAHCSECGDPVFRYDGQEFCPTCERPVERENGTGAEAEDEGDGSVEVTSPREDTRVVFGDDESEPTPEQRDHEQPGANREQGSRDTQRDELTQGDRGRESDPGARDTPGGHAKGPGRQRAPAATVETDNRGSDADAGIEAARASLVRTLTVFSQRAETTDDPRRAREHLQTAREAAETLAALRR